MDLFNQFKISLRANNQISITRQKLAARREDRYELAVTPSLSQSGKDSLMVRYAKREGARVGRKFYETNLRLYRDPVKVGLTAYQRSLLDITSKFQRGDVGKEGNEKETKKGYGAMPRIKSFSAKAGQKIRECGGAIDYLCEGDPAKCRVITLTLPSSEVDAFRAISCWSGYATNRLLQIIRRERDDEYHWFYVWEHQKRGALHAHICLYHSDGEKSRMLGEKLVSKWRDILCDIGRLSGVDLLFSRGFRRQVALHEMQSNSQQMRKGCGAYFSKYAAKTSNVRDTGGIETINTRNARLYPPSSFWGRSQNLVKLCNSLSFKWKYEGINGEETESLQAEALEILSQKNIVLHHNFHFKKEIELEGNGSLTIAEGKTEVFYVSPSDYLELLAHFRYIYESRLSCAILERARKKRGVESMPVGFEF